MTISFCASPKGNRYNNIASSSRASVPRCADIIPAHRKSQGEQVQPSPEPPKATKPTGYKSRNGGLRDKKVAETAAAEQRARDAEKRAEKAEAAAKSAKQVVSA